MGKWEMVRWEQVLQIKNGKNQKAVESSSGVYPIYGSGGIMGYANEYICPEKTTIIGRKGSINSPIYVEQKFWNVDTAFGLVANSDLDSKFLYYFCIQYNFQRHNKAVTIPSLTKSDLLQISMPLPPINEQKRIAKNLDLASEIVNGYKEQLAELDKLVHSVFYEMFGDTYINPFSFPISTLDKLADIVSGITKGRKLNTSQQVFKVPYMAVSNVKAGYIDWTKIKTIAATKEEIERYRILEDDILMTEGGDPDKLGRGSIINMVPQNCIHQNHIFRVRCNKQTILPKYFSEYLKHVSAKQYFLKCAKQTTGIASINMTQLRLLPVIVPPLTIQTRFASIVTEIETQKAQVEQAMTEAENLFNSLMQEYFE